MRILFVFPILFSSSISLFAQSDEEVIKKIYDETLANGKSYELLDYLSNNIGGRLAGSPEAAAAVEFTKQAMEDLEFDTVFLQPVMVPHWVRGKAERAKILNSERIGSQDVNICAIGNSVGTGEGGITAEIIEVQSFEELEQLGESKIKGKIVFFNRPFDVTLINTFSAYSGAVNQRGSGASQAAKYGAVGVVVRSMTSSLDDVPHTGALRYDESYPKIPAVAISTKDAELLSKLLKDDEDLKFYFETHCEMKSDVLSYNVVGELKGSQNPEEILVVGGHLDAWDLGDGAHDDGSGCVQAIEALRIFKALGIKPKRTLRAVMFMNEENGLRGGRKYADLAEENNEIHVAAIESDRGGFTPRGFTMSVSDSQYKQISNWSHLFKPFGASEFIRGGGGADIGPLERFGTALIGFYPDPQRYFDYHHATTDTFDKINKRELDLGAGTMASLLYLLDKYGLKK